MKLNANDLTRFLSKIEFNFAGPFLYETGVIYLPHHLCRLEYDAERYKRGLTANQKEK
jgi:hypothetical protein